jgi:hypothetical protein
MITKHFDYQEFIKTKSLNCDSCGGGLTINMSNGKTCDCEYCGNTNLILESGKTKILSEVCVPKKTETIKTKSKPMNIFVMMLFGVAAIGLFFYMYRYIKNKK